MISKKPYTSSVICMMTMCIGSVLLLYQFISKHVLIKVFHGITFFITGKASGNNDLCLKLKVLNAGHDKLGTCLRGVLEMIYSTNFHT